ncbi:hypothetical protein ROZALSC1DRAFT_29204 [Rozella allomycis CSF55]|uniref:ASX DEUBAD domain-containing protein n=1 Tax=Rozella allomycis (strain CSF55) TaxID=988480 RepID=A0A075B149_ROZAC|nr:hypothetical protein O9G_004674 [Rozella allomycis CSF55]RKP19171.1 hypothetical protein ROZALSC1DRAFT_29204 [Rozella allomycis CSF55]|eukprot:EPZ36304.1 hypothetical protein O9G_004674 [Rozella allomycis CSF55]
MEFEDGISLSMEEDRDNRAFVFIFYHDDSEKNNAPENPKEPESKENDHGVEIEDDNESCILVEEEILDIDSDNGDENKPSQLLVDESDNVENRENDEQTKKRGRPRLKKSNAVDNSSQANPRPVRAAKIKSYNKAVFGYEELTHDFSLEVPIQSANVEVLPIPVKEKKISDEDKQRLLDLLPEADLVNTEKGRFLMPNFFSQNHVFRSYLTTFQEHLYYGNFLCNDEEISNSKNDDEDFEEGKRKGRKRSKFPATPKVENQVKRKISDELKDAVKDISLSKHSLKMQKILKMSKTIKIVKRKKEETFNRRSRLYSMNLKRNLHLEDWQKQVFEDHGIY